MFFNHANRVNGLWARLWAPMFGRRAQALRPVSQSQIAPDAIARLVDAFEDRPAASGDAPRQEDAAPRWGAPANLIAAPPARPDVTRRR
ncbi:hypothetical protein SAMN05421759_110106 [Roseivivax lentus]|uniref:Uncharacterized protein n=1 Tax=Roseivivax lentus TaxID=633194 RepID=A0A1N7NVQ5_9RHOB|nr:hypothetical protein [Roseivivax lentus]SIT02397.1 hypothetical protein SAMN05421759_110106 [Roseivivax lentus]